MKYNSTYHPQFITATILEWKHLLKDDAYKDIIISSLQFLHKEGSIVVYAFVIMPNHMHMIWQIQDGYVQDKIQQRFLKFTGQQMKFKLIDEKNKMLNEFLVEAKDRTYQIWEPSSAKCSVSRRSLQLSRIYFKVCNFHFCVPATIRRSLKLQCNTSEVANFA